MEFALNATGFLNPTRRNCLLKPILITGLICFAVNYAIITIFIGFAFERPFFTSANKKESGESESSCSIELS